MDVQNVHDFNELLGETFIKVVQEDREIHFFTADTHYVLLHIQDCCENVYIEDVVGDLQDLVGFEILKAEESYQDGIVSEGDSSTWSFYKLATIKGYVDIRFYGESSGYYSESAGLVSVKE